MSMIITILNGPNLNFLGKREPEIYGTETLKDIEQFCKECATRLGVRIHFYQSNYEGQLVEWIQEAIGVSAGLIINPAAYSHTSVAILDALKMFTGTKVEVHLSHIYHREAFRHHSYTSAAVDAVIAGCGGDGYWLALEYIVKRFNRNK
ncbi:3-dehydroquinate dehydratase [Bartonella henselae]|uniref:3-dehydroquinate dehydratase n=1 Tax=Bartonella henselae (strain ATCC 49882 / DSM 28221 / CCUG 30454 / Houston 1) TaxID=283166 RepID=AROQ_BARHE|nr:type II 3-dehydroquinate dehydratase [Bartonella henselae]Q6G523.1 RecName: Full=3-dehydroquinate dehydratase; Short=3-dehydroquinase; AltName: Full=Type II DHQase [Bartonella henselae str. Houston-1]ATP11765.1 type II 3-dehydroquinate dehydratase [Bartonella henselae]ETS09210.1 3-dehydroquinate dehydratase [Bartonella henselae JK 50]ETS09367.1 3-dehydroquinate dehydratase [Bartonella henselae JK 51]MDM9990776.1 type II 3-dehydroquinate dehydratase [Bartonella henselae]OLL39095.1 3-dehydro